MKDEIKDLPWERLVDEFAADALLPCVRRGQRMTTTELYNTFEVFCQQLGLQLPCGIQNFSKQLAQRYQTMQSNGKRMWCVEYRPEIFDGE